MSDTLNAADQASPPKKHPIIRLAEKGKRAIAGVLLVLMFILLSVSVIELVYAFVVTAFPSIGSLENGLLLSEAQLLSTFGIFLSVLIALELVETVEVYFKDHSIHAEIVVLVAIIALARKVVLLDLTYYKPLTILGMAALFIGLAATYMAIKWGHRGDPEGAAE